MSRLKNLYTYLIANRRAELDGWLARYVSFTTEVNAVRQALLQGGQLTVNVTYKETEFSKQADAWKAFAKELLRSPDNRITGCGLSVLSIAHFEIFIKNDAFIDALKELIKTPTRDTFEAFQNIWEHLCTVNGANRTPLLVNRTLAACTVNVTTTVNVADFESVYWWLGK